MQALIEKIKMNQSLQQKYIVLVPNVRTRASVERIFIDEVQIVANIEFLTLGQYIDEITLDFRIENDIDLLEPAEEVKMMFDIISKQEHCRLFQEHQINLDLARLLSQEYMKIATAQNYDQLFYGKYSVPLTAIYKDYEQTLQANNQWDTVAKFRYVTAMELPFINDKVLFFDENKYLPIERQVITALNGQLLARPTNVQQQNVNLYKSYGNKVAFDHFIEQVVVNSKVDDVVILYTDDQLVDQISTALQRYQLPATFSRGVSFSSTRIYEAVKSLLEYVESNYQSKYLKDTLESNVFESESMPFNMKAISTMLTINGIEYGKRIAPLVKKYIAEKESKIEDENVVKQIENLQAFAAFFEQLQTKLESLTVEGAQYFDILIDILWTNTARKTKQMKIELKFLMNLLFKLKEMSPELTSFQSFKVFLLKELENTKWNANGEMPGHIFVAHYEDQLLVHRRTAAVFGLDANTFPKLPTSSPFIQESSYEELGLCSPENALHNSMDSLQNTISTIHGPIHLYANTYNTNRVRTQNISTFFQKLMVNGVLVTDVTYVLADQQTIIEQQQPLLESFTIDWTEKNEKDEFVNVLSPTSIDKLIDCNRKYFFDRKLRVSKLNEMKENVKTWLPSNILGTMIHEVLEECAKLYNKEKLSKEKLSIEDMQEQAEIIYETYKAQYVPVVEAHYTYELERLKGVIEQFYVHLQQLEEEGWMIQEFEMDIPENTMLQVDVGDGEIIAIPIKGKLDRQDKKRNEEIYRTIDYKTGSKKYIKHIQLYLYNESLRDSNKDVSDKDTAFYMVFDGELISFDKTSLNKSKQDNPTIMEKFQQKIKSFDLNDVQFKASSDACKYCEFRQVCSGLEAK